MNKKTARDKQRRQFRKNREDRVRPYLNLIEEFGPRKDTSDLHPQWSTRYLKHKKKARRR